MSTCSSCNQEIVWARSHPNGKMMPLDPDPSPDGNVVMTASTDARGNPVVLVLRRGEVRNGVDHYVTHFTTCPNAKDHRKRH